MTHDEAIAAQRDRLAKLAEQDAAGLPRVHAERFRRPDGTCGCDLCRFGGQNHNLAAALRYDLPLGPVTG